MAARQDFLLQLDQNLVLQLKAIVSSDITDFDKLTDDQKKTLFIAALSAGYKTNLELFLDLKTHPEKVGLSPLSPEELTEAFVNAQIIAANVEKYRADLAAAQNEVETKLPNRSQSDKALIYRLLRVAAIRKEAERLNAESSEQTRSILEKIAHEADTKTPPQTIIQRNIASLVDTAIATTGLIFTPGQKQEVINTVVTATLAEVESLSAETSRSEVLQIALSAHPDYHTPTSDLFRNIDENVIHTPSPDYGDSDNRQITDHLAFNLNNLTLPTEEINISGINFPVSSQHQDRLEETQKLITDFSEKILTNEKTEIVMAELTGAITPEQEVELTQILIAENLLARKFPTSDGAAAAVVIEKLNPVNPFISSASTRIGSMGLKTEEMDRHLIDKPGSKLAEFARKNPGVINKIRSEIHRLNNPKNDLGKEISESIRARAAQTGTLPPHIPHPTRPGPLSSITAQYQSITNRISGFLPGNAGQAFNAVTHPIQFIQSKIGNFIGNRVVGQFKNWLAKKVVSKIANETLKKGAEFILKQGLKRGLQSLAVALGAPTGGVSLLLAAAIEIGSWLAEKTFGLAKNAINGLSRALTGEDFDARAALAAPLVALAGIGGILGSLGAAVSVAAMSAGVILIISTIVGFFFYIIVLTVAPIITTIAQLDSGLGPQQGPAFGGVYEPYTGPVLPGCSQIWPVSGGFVLQGPHGIYSHLTVEAVDIYAPIGTPVKSMSSGIVTLTGWGDAYGNWIKIRSTSENGKSYTVIYSHLSEIGVQVGNPVGVGTVIALSGATSSVPGFANPHLHMEYLGIAYNSCPAGGVQVPDGCAGAVVGKPNACLINGKPIYTN